MPVESKNIEPVLGAGVVLYHQDKIFLVHQTESDKWSLPKGHQEEKENLRDTWKRELKEESGIDISKFRYQERGSFKYGYYLYVVIQILDRDLPKWEGRCGNKEIDVGGWFSIDNALILNNNAPTNYSLNRVFIQQKYSSAPRCQTNYPNNLKEI